MVLFFFQQVAVLRDVANTTRGEHAQPGVRHADGGVLNWVELLEEFVRVSKLG